MSKWDVTIKATVEIEDPQTLDQLIIARMYEDKTGSQAVDTGRGGPLFKNDGDGYDEGEFEIIKYPDNWLDFTEVIE